MSYFTKWSEDWLNAKNEREALSQFKNNEQATVDTDALSKRYYELEQFNPREDENLLTALASEGATNTDYYNIYKTTNSNDYRKYSGYVPTEAKEHTSFVKSALAADFRNPLKIGSLAKKTLDIRYPGTNFSSLLWNGALLALESITYPVQGIFGPAMGIEYEAAADRILKKRGDTSGARSFRSYPGEQGESKKLPWSIKARAGLEAYAKGYGLSGTAGAIAGAKLGAAAGAAGGPLGSIAGGGAGALFGALVGATGQAIVGGGYENNPGIQNDFIRFAPSESALEYLGDINVDYKQIEKDNKTNLGAVLEAAPDIYNKNLQVVTDGVKRELTFNEKSEIFYRTANELLAAPVTTEESSIEVFGKDVAVPQFFNRSEVLQDAIISRDGLYAQGITANIGDYYRMALVGSMENKYSPKYALTQDIDEAYEISVLAIRQLLAQGDITEDQQKELLEDIETTANEMYSDLKFNPDAKGAGRYFSGIINAYIMYKTDLFVAGSKGVGVGGRSVDKDVVLAGLGKQYNDEVIKGGMEVSEWWAKNDDALRGWTNKFQQVMEESPDAPALLAMVENGMHPEFALRLVDNPSATYNILKQGITEGFVADVRAGSRTIPGSKGPVGGETVGDVVQYALQPKVLDDAFVDNIAELMKGNVDEVFNQAAYSRTGSILDIFLGRDRRLPSMPWGDLSNPQNAADTFYKVANMLSIPDPIIEKYLRQFVRAVQNGDQALAQKIYYDDLLKVEGAIQLKALFGLADDEIANFMQKNIDEVRGFGVEGGIYNASILNKFRDPDFINVIVKKTFGSLFANEEDLIKFSDKFISIIGQTRDMSIAVPNLRQTLRYTGLKRKLRNRWSGSKTVDESIATIRKAHDEGVPGTFFDPDTPLGEITKGAFADMKDPSALYKGLETGIGLAETGLFTAVSRGWMPLQLLFRLSFPLKVMLDGQLRMGALGIDSLFRNPVGLLKLLANDPEGYLAKGLGIDVYTGLTGPFRTVSEKGPQFLPRSMRKVMNLVKEGKQEYSVPEVMAMFARDPKFTSQFTKPTDLWDEALKQGTKNVKLKDGTVLPFVPNDEFIESYVDFLVTQLTHDPLMPTIARGLREGLTDDEMVKQILDSQELTQELLTLNQRIIARNQKNGTVKIVKIIEDDTDVANLVAQYRQTINGFAGGSDDIIDVIATGTIKGIDLKSFSILKQTQATKAKNEIQKIMQPVYEDLPSSVPMLSKNVNKEAANFVTAFFDSMFFAVGQIEAVWSRIPTFKQAYFYFLENNIPFAQKEALAELLAKHFDPESVIKLPDNIVQAAKENLEAARITPEELQSIMNAKVPVKLQYNANSIDTVLYNTEGLFDVRLFRGTSATDEIVFDLDLQKAEFTAFGSEREIANVRAGANNTKISAYSASIHDEALIVNGGLSEQQLTKLKQNLTTKLEDNTLVDKIIDDFVKALDDNPGMSYAEILERLGISNKEFNIAKITDDLRKGRHKEGDVNPAIIKRVLGLDTKKSIPNKKIIDGEETNIWNDAASGEFGGSYDLSKKVADSQDIDFLEGIYVSPYKTRTKTFRTLDELESGTIAPIEIEKMDFTAQVVKEYIETNKDLLRRQGHYLGIWDDGSKVYMDVSIKIPLKEQRGLIDEQIAKAMYVGLLSEQRAIAVLRKISTPTVGADGKQVVIDTLEKTYPKVYKKNGIATHTSLNYIKQYGTDLLENINKLNSLIRNTGIAPIVKGKRGQVNSNNVLFSTGMHGNLNTVGDANKLILFGGKDNPQLNKLTQIDYFSMLDLHGIRSNLKRNMTFDDLNRRAAEYGYELHNRLLYNLLERGYLAEAYRVALPFFEAYREVLGRYATLGAVNTRAASQVQHIYRRGVETNIIYEDKYGEKYLILPVGGTPLEDYVKSEGRGTWVNDMDVDDSKVILKRGIPISALGVAGGGLYPPLGPVVALPVGYLTKDKPDLRRMFERTIFQFGLPFESRGDTFLGEALEESMPSVGRNLLGAVFGEDSPSFGLDEDIWLRSVNEGLQIAAVLYPNIAQDFEALEPIAQQISKNIYQLKSWDRFINPYAPNLRLLYQVDVDDEMFAQWYGKKGEESGLMWNSFVELAVIHSYYRDLRDYYSHYMGTRAADFEATKQMVLLFDLGKYDLEDSYTSVALVKQGKKITESGKLPMTKPEYDFVNDNEEDYKKYGGSILYFFEGLGTGDVDYSAYQSLDNLGKVTPLTSDEFFYSAAMYGSSIVERALKNAERKRLQQQGYKNTDDLWKISMAKIDFKLREMFPLAYGRDLGELSKLDGYSTVSKQEYDIEIRMMEEMYKDKAFNDSPVFPLLEEYLIARESVIASVMTVKQQPTRQDAIDFITRNDSEDAQEMRDLLYYKGVEIAKKNYMFAIMWDEVFYEEISYYGIGTS